MLGNLIGNKPQSNQMARRHGEGRHLTAHLPSQGVDSKSESGEKGREVREVRELKTPVGQRRQQSS